MANRPKNTQAVQLPMGFPQLAAQGFPRPREKNGAVYTRAWVVDLMLDLAGYTPDRPLHEMLAIEPAAGEGAFLVRMACRLVEAARMHDVAPRTLNASLLGYELDETTAQAARTAVIRALANCDVKEEDAHFLAQHWVRTGDYLLDAPTLPSAQFVIGNPPYIRLEDIDATTASTYRAMYGAMRGRADLYVAFFEAALRQLADYGVCAYICADRWMLNQYGAELRRFITRTYGVEAVVRLHATEAFADEVSAYPAISVIRRGQQSAAVVATADWIAEQSGGAAIASFLGTLRTTEESSTAPAGIQATRIDGWFTDGDPWPHVSPERLALLRYLEARFPTLQDDAMATRVGIGVATGADDVYITTDADLVESSRLLPLALAGDCENGSRVRWSGHYLVNPSDDNGIVSLDSFPRLRSYFADHASTVKRRFVASKSSSHWYRTIDRVNRALTYTPKLFIADIKDWLTPVLDEGTTYPHHNLYYVTSTDWDLEVLGGLLLSSVAHFFMECYAVRMRGGYLRFQAQYLRRVRVPRPAEISAAQAAQLIEAFRRRDRTQASRMALEIYGIPEIPGGGEFPVTNDDLDARLQEAVQRYWNTREMQKLKSELSKKQDTGSRGAVTGGAQMVPIEDLVRDVIVQAGINPADIKTRRKLQLPGYYRAEKKWDLLVVTEGKLVAAIEFKGQVGSIGNNANNRMEEVIGSADDIWTAYREGLLGNAPEPFLGYFFVLEDSPTVHKPVKNAEPHFEVDPAFKNADYAKRYELLCRRLVLERKYRATCLALATNETPTKVTHPTDDLSFRRFIAALRGHIVTFQQS